MLTIFILVCGQPTHGWLTIIAILEIIANHALSLSRITLIINHPCFSLSDIAIQTLNLSIKCSIRIAKQGFTDLLYHTTFKQLLLKN